MYWDTDEERSHLIAEYLKVGLKKNERCLCVADDHISRVVGLCLYDRRLLDAATLERASHTHPFIGADGDLFNNSHFDPANQLRAAWFDSASFDVAVDRIRRNAGTTASLSRTGRHQA